MLFWEIRKTRIESETVVDIAKYHLSQQKIVHLYEYWTAHDIYLKINCDATSSVM